MSILLVIDKKSLLKTNDIASFQRSEKWEIKIISFYAKKARGLMVRFILDNGSKTPEDLKGFNYGGYSFSEIESQKEKELVFIR